MTELAERLGHDPEARLLILRCAGLGQAHAANAAVYECLRTGLATTAGLMVPCPWARDAALRFRGDDVGIALTLNAELDNYRWGPITHAPSLLDGDGGFPRTPDDLWDHADIDEVRRECRAQIERAVLWGLRITHLDTHLGALARRPEFFDVYLELAVDFRLPICLADASAEARIGFPARRLAAEEGVLVPDHLIELRGRPARQALEEALFELEPGVSALTFAPALDVPEIRGLDPHWSRRVEDYLALSHDTSLTSLIDRAGVTLIGYGELQQVMANP
ncbi:MAG: ChbG/HpnK family deacetylase [Acidimicrobiales bacterium]|nr:ChbG/HpnK family deacetylase [Acidimicrobiales bacterium]